MKPIICLYCDGADTKVAVLTKEKTGLTVQRVFSANLMKSSADAGADLGSLSFDDSELKLEESESDASGIDLSSSKLQSEIMSELGGINLSQYQFIPILTDPSVFYQSFTKKTDDVKSIAAEIFAEDEGLRAQKYDRENFALIKLADNANLLAFIDRDIGCVKLINQLASLNNKKRYNIYAIKTAEVSLAHYVARTQPIEEDSFSLIVHRGKEFSKLIFLHGTQLKHIGSTLEISVDSEDSYNYDLYLSKILLEMENGGVPNLDKIFLCGEDTGEGAVTSFSEIFPEAETIPVTFDNFVTSGLDTGVQDNLNAFAVPLAVGYEVMEEATKKYKGINLLPRYIKEEQNIFQVGWHTFAILPLLFVAAFYITFQVLSNDSKVGQLENEILIRNQLKAQNLEILSQIEALDQRISSFDATQELLDSAQAGTEVWGDFIARKTSFIKQRRNLWIRNVTADNFNNVVLEGHALYKYVLTDFCRQLNNATLKSINYDPIREVDAYRFTILLDLENSQLDSIWQSDTTSMAGQL